MSAAAFVRWVGAQRPFPRLAAPFRPSIFHFRRRSIRTPFKSRAVSPSAPKNERAKRAVFAGNSNSAAVFWGAGVSREMMHNASAEFWMFDVLSWFSLMFLDGLVQCWRTCFGSCFSPQVFFVLFAPASAECTLRVFWYSTRMCVYVYAYGSRTIMFSIQSIDGEHDKVIYTVRQSNILC